MFNFRKFLRLAPYNRPAPSLKDFAESDFTTVAFKAAPTPTIKTDGQRWYIVGTDKSYTRRRDAVRGWNRMVAA